MIPCPVSSSVPSPMMNPIIARRPFQVSAKEEKPNLLPIVVLKNVTNIQAIQAIWCTKCCNRTAKLYPCVVVSCRNDENPIPAWGAEVAARQRVAVLVDAIAEVPRYSLRVDGSGNGLASARCGQGGRNGACFFKQSFLATSLAIRPDNASVRTRSAADFLSPRSLAWPGARPPADCC